MSFAQLRSLRFALALAAGATALSSRADMTINAGSDFGRKGVDIILNQLPPEDKAFLNQRNMTVIDMNKDDSNTTLFRSENNVLHINVYNRGMDYRTAAAKLSEALRDMRSNGTYYMNIAKDNPSVPAPSPVATPAPATEPSNPLTEHGVRIIVDRLSPTDREYLAKMKIQAIPMSLKEGESDLFRIEKGILYVNVRNRNMKYEQAAGILSECLGFMRLQKADNGFYLRVPKDQSQKIEYDAPAPKRKWNTAPVQEP